MKKTLFPCIVALFIAFALPASADLYKFVVPLDGAQESPGPGDGDGSGTAILWIDSSANTVTWDITVANIDLPLTGAHIHQAPVGVPGPVVVSFNAMLTGGPVFDSDLAAVLANPTSYYVNVHNSLFPAGAIRGQLGTAVRVPDGGSTAGLLVLGMTALGWVARRRSVR